MLTVDLDMKIKFLQGFAHKTRIQILEQLKEEEKTVSHLVDALNGKQSNISQHLACLKGCGLIVGRQEGKYIYYRLRNEQIKELLNMFDGVFEQIENDVACCDRHIG